MAIQYLLTRFTFGEIAPTAEGNVVAEFYSSSMRDGTNTWLTKDGAAKRRWGTEYVAPTWGDENGVDSAPLLFPFRGSDAAYILEFSGQPGTGSGNEVRVRVYDEDGDIVSPTGTPPDTYTFIMPTPGTGYKNIRYCVENVLDNLDVTAAGNEINVFCRSLPIAVITYSPGGNFSVAYKTLEGNPYLADDIGADGFNKLDSGGTSRLEFVTGGTFSGLTASAREAKKPEDVAVIDMNRYSAREEWIGKHVYLTDGSKSCLVEITRIISGDIIMGIVKQGDNAANPWSVSSLSFWSPVLGSRTSVRLYNTVAPFVSGDIGLSYMLDSGAGVVESVGSTTESTLRIVQQGLVANAGAAISGTTANVNNIKLPRFIRRWARPAWGNNTTSTYTNAVETGWPSLSVFFQGRLFCAASKAERQTIWGSKTERFDNFAPGSEPNDPLQWEIATDENAEITALCAGAVLFVGTKTALYRVVAAEGISQENFRPVNSLGYGLARVKPVLVGGWFAAVRASGTAIMAFRYNDSAGVTEDDDMTKFAKHVGDGGVIQLAASAYNDPRVVALRSDGKMFTGTFIDSPTIPAWTGFETDGVIESVAVMRGFSGDQIWMCVKRTIDGNERRYIERAIDGVYLDSSLGEADVSLTDTANGIVVGGLDHLEGESITVMLEGAAYEGLTVTGGEVTVPVTEHSGYSPFRAGIPYESRIRTHRVSTQLRDGTDQIRRKAVKSVGVRVIDTRHLSVKGSSDNSETPSVDIPFHRTTTPMDSMRQPFTGDAETTVRGGYDTDGSVTIASDKPWDFTVTLIRIGVDFQDGTASGA